MTYEITIHVDSETGKMTVASNVDSRLGVIQLLAVAIENTSNDLLKGIKEMDNKSNEKPN